MIDNPAELAKSLDDWCIAAADLTWIGPYDHGFIAAARRLCSEYIALTDQVREAELSRREVTV